MELSIEKFERLYAVPEEGYTIEHLWYDHMRLAVWKFRMPRKWKKKYLTKQNN